MGATWRNRGNLVAACLETPSVFRRISLTCYDLASEYPFRASTGSSSRSRWSSPAVSGVGPSRVHSKGVCNDDINQDDRALGLQCSQRSSRIRGSVRRQHGAAAPALLTRAYIQAGALGAMGGLEGVPGFDNT